MKRILIFGFLLAFAYAQNTNETGPSGLTPSTQGGGGSSNINIIGGYSDQYWTPPKNVDSSQQNLYLFTQSPTYSYHALQGLFFNNYLNNLTQTSTTNTSSQNPLNPQTSLTAQGLNALLTATPTNTITSLANAMAQYFPLTSPNFVYNFEKNQVSGPQGTTTGAQSNADQSNINVLNIGALIEPAQYDTDSYDLASNAKNFIGYISNQFNPIPLIDFTQIISSSQLAQALNNPAVQQYLLTIRQTVANDSTGMNNLYYLYNERVSQNTNALLGTQFTTIAPGTLPQNLQTKASPLALEKWMATHRLTNYQSDKNTPTWSDAMETATPATLQRETVYLLAEIRYEMYQQRMLQERILATASVQQLQNADSQQMTLQQLQRTICQDPLFSNACPPQPAAPVIGGS